MVREAPEIVLPTSVDSLGRRLRASMRWYSKGASARTNVEAFAFLWIAAETLSKPLRPDLEKQPIKTSCGHFISECPECQRSILKTPNGDIMRAILVDAGVPEEMAKRLWRTRQMFHGQNDLTGKANRGLPEELGVLREAVQMMIRRLYSEALGLDVGAVGPGSIIDAEVAPVIELTVGAELAKRLQRWEELGLRGS